MKNEKRVLVVDDEVSVRELIVNILDFLDVSSETAGNGAEALLKMRTQRFDLIISDIDMPVMGGIELWQSVSAMSNPPSFVFVTGNSSDERRETLARVGYTGLVIGKPFSLEAIEALV